MLHCTHTIMYKMNGARKQTHAHVESMIITHYQVFSAVKFHLFHFLCAPFARSFFFSFLLNSFYCLQLTSGMCSMRRCCWNMRRLFSYDSNQYETIAQMHGTHVSAFLSYHRCKIVNRDSISCSKHLQPNTHTHQSSESDLILRNQAHYRLGRSTVNNFVVTLKILLMCFPISFRFERLWVCVCVCVCVCARISCFSCSQRKINEWQ